MLLTKENRRDLPPLYSQDGQGMEAVAYVKFFGGGRWTFYATEFDGQDTFFGWCVSALGPDCDELGYLSLAELEAMRFPPFGLGAERDRYFRPAKLSAILEPASSAA